MNDRSWRFAFDKKTGFPCVCRPSSRWYLSLLPLTKVQVEQYIASGAAARDSLALQGQPRVSISLRDMLRPRMVERYCDYFQAGRYAFDQEVFYESRSSTMPIDQLLARQPITAFEAEESLLATNLPHCDYGHEFSENESVPQAGSPLDQILKWLGTRQGLVGKNCREAGPLLSIDEYERWTAASSSVAAVRYCAAVLPLLRHHSNRAARRILEQLVGRGRFGAQQGFPFWNHGIWELATTKVGRQVSAGEQPGVKWMVQACGKSSFLPSIVQQGGVHVLLIEHHPAIGCRPVFPEESVEVLGEFDWMALQDADEGMKPIASKERPR
jgi:hypothetical protein